MFVQQQAEADNKENIKALDYWPFARGIKPQGWIPLTKGQ